MTRSDISGRREVVELLLRSERTGRHRDAIARCSTALLRGETNDDMRHALDALLDVLGTSSVFVDRNVDHGTLGPCSSTVHLVSQTGSNMVHDRWQLMPWSRLPDSRAALSRGRVFHLHVDQLGATEAQSYAGSGVASELDVPISISGRWAGIIGVCSESPRSWEDDEVVLLRTVGEMIGVFWERQEDRRRLHAAMAATEKHLRYERALSECSQALLFSQGDAALQTAIDALVMATEARWAFVEENVNHAELGPCTRPLVVAQFENGTLRSPGDASRSALPWSSLPESHRTLSAGKPHCYRTDHLGPTERSIFERWPNPMQSGIDIPICVGGDWAGVIGLADVAVERSWDADDIRLVQTAADMIGALWSEQRTRRRLERSIQSKDEFLAAVSHELRTPLTGIVGLATELRDHPDRFVPEERADLISLLAAEGIEMANIVEDLLVASRADLAGLAIDPSRVSVAVEAKRVIEGLGLADRIELAGQCGVAAYADPLRLRQILRNVISNAVRHGGDRVSVRIAASAGSMTIAVRDNGPPVPNPELIFEPYETGPPTARSPGSVGLGLTISRRLARLMSGEVDYRREGPENVFSLSLPGVAKTTQESGTPGR